MSCNCSKCCACDLASKYMDSLTTGLAEGTLTYPQFSTLIANNFNVTATEVEDVNGNKSCQVVFNSTLVPVTGISITGTNTVTVGNTTQLTGVIAPLNASNQDVIWISADTNVATVDSNGLVTGVLAGSVIIYAYSAANPTLFDTITVTVS